MKEKNTTGDINPIKSILDQVKTARNLGLPSPDGHEISI